MLALPPPHALPSVAQYMSGLTALESKVKAGAVCDVSDISKRGRALVEAGALRVVRPHKGPESQKPAKLKSAFRLKPGQVEKLAAQQYQLKRHTTDAFKKVTTAVEEAVHANKGQTRRSMCAMVAEANATLPPFAPKTAVSSVGDAVRSGLAGMSPKKRIPPSKVGTVITDAARSWAQVGQVSGDENTSSSLRQHILTAAVGTPAEGTRRQRGAAASCVTPGHLDGQCSLRGVFHRKPGCRNKQSLNRDFNRTKKKVP